jgi:hypothetical protein
VDETIKNDEQVKPAIATNLTVSDRPHLVENKVFARDEPSDPWLRSRLPPDRIDGTKLGHGLDTCLDVQRSWLPIWPHTVPIKETIRHVTRLLDFGDEEPCPDRMHGTGGDEHAIAGPGVEGMEHCFAGAGSNGSGKVGSPDSLTETGVDATAGVSINDIPGLGLASVGRRKLGSAGIVRMNLHGEHLMSIKKLEEQRKFRVLSVRSQQCRAMVTNQLPK